MPIEIFEHSLLKFLQRQGSDSDRKLIILDSGELGYSVDTERLFVGDGVTSGGIVVGNKYRGKSSIITNLSPCEVGDYGYEESSESLYVLESNNGTNLTDWKMVATSTKTTATSPLTSVGGELDLTVESPLYVEDNTLKLSLSSGAILNSSDVIDIIYPVGSIFFTTIDINPSSYFVGTTWGQVSQGRFIAGVGTGTDINTSSKTLSSGNNAGEYYHTITTPELPSHTHEGYNVSIGRGGDDMSGVVNWNDSIVGNGLLVHENSGHTNNIVTSPIDKKRSLDGQPVLDTVGENSPHNNTPPSFGLYVWKRLT